MTLSATDFVSDPRLAARLQATFDEVLAGGVWPPPLSARPAPADQRTQTVRQLRAAGLFLPGDRVSVRLAGVGLRDARVLRVAHSVTTYVDADPRGGVVTVRERRVTVYTVRLDTTGQVLSLDGPALSGVLYERVGLDWTRAWKPRGGQS